MIFSYIRFLLAALFILPCVAWSLDEQAAADSSASLRVYTGDEFISRAYDPVTLDEYSDSSATPTGMSLVTRLYYLVPETLILPREMVVDSLFMRLGGLIVCDSAAVDTSKFVLTITGDTVRYDTTCVDTFSLDSTACDTFYWSYYETDTFTLVADFESLTLDTTCVDSFSLETGSTDSFYWSYYETDTATVIEDEDSLYWEYCDVETSLVWEYCNIDTCVAYRLDAYRKTAYHGFSEITATFAYHGDSLYYDTLTFRTYGNTTLVIPKRYDAQYGTTASGSFDIAGYRSPGMDVYCSRSTLPIVEANDTTAVEFAERAWTYTLSVADGGIDTLSFWGLNDNGDSSDTLVVARKYKQLFGFQRRY